eukprot:2397600-Alexandrium_andersonii.AAC.1
MDARGHSHSHKVAGGPGGGRAKRSTEAQSQFRRTRPCAHKPTPPCQDNTRKAPCGHSASGFRALQCGKS